MDALERAALASLLGFERRAKANNDDQMALLNFAKAMKEIEGIDIAHLEKIVSLQRMLKDYESIKENETSNPQPLQNSSESVR